MGIIGEIQAPPDEDPRCDWDAVGEECDRPVRAPGELCGIHEMQAPEENEADMANKRAKEDW